MPCDVIVVGAGPAGSFAALLLARAGARVRLFDRDRFPRDKLCGDTLNPGALRLLEAHGLSEAIKTRGLPIEGMLLTGPTAKVSGRYPPGVTGRSLPRRDLDQLLVDNAVQSGVQFEERVKVVSPIADAADVVIGVRIATTGRKRSTCDERARLVIAADGRDSRLARTLGLAGHAARPRRWAVGGYFENVRDMWTRGEMHVRSGHYIGLSPVPGGLTNACFVAPAAQRDAAAWRNPASLLLRALASDVHLADRFRDAHLVTPTRVLGPMAVESRGVGVPGLLLAGDAAGFIDPITGDGMRLALTGASLVASIAAELLAGHLSPDRAVHLLAERRRAALRTKWHFNRSIRSVVARPAAVASAALAARLAPGAFERVIRYAGDC